LPRVLILEEATMRRFPSDTSLDRFLDREVAVLRRSYDDLDYELRCGEVAVVDSGSGDALSAFDLVVLGLKPSAVLAGEPAVIAGYLGRNEIPCINPYGLRAVSPFPRSKLAQYALMADAGLPYPHVVYVAGPARLAESYTRLATTLGTPFILKCTRGNNGKDNYLVTDSSAFAAALSNAEPDKLPPSFLAQTYLPNNGDIRVNVFGAEPPVVFRRIAATGSHLNNVSRGGRTLLVSDPDAEEIPIRLALAAATLMEYPIGGVDLIQDHNSGAWSVLEVNEFPPLYGTFDDVKAKAFARLLTAQCRAPRNATPNGPDPAPNAPL
jgi:glutathione synthase/RimK-type ligase-like ATP-grasp enzyme